jgi:hypothetical protein
MIAFLEAAFMVLIKKEHTIAEIIANINNGLNIERVCLCTIVVCCTGASF